MRHHRIDIGHFIMMAIMFVIVGSLAAFLFGYVAMSLWNWLIPPLFGLKTLTFWQTFGLLILSWIFFGRFRGGHYWHGRRWRRRMFERWERMTPEEREKFRAKMRDRWGRHHDEPPAAGNTA
jgi:hypothetical protein